VLANDAGGTMIKAESSTGHKRKNAV